MDETESKEDDDIPARKKLNIKDEESAADKVYVSTAFCDDVLIVFSCVTGVGHFKSGTDSIYTIILEGCYG